MKQWLRELWCGLTTGHDFEASWVVVGTERRIGFCCLDCDALFKARPQNTKDDVFRDATVALDQHILTFVDPAFPKNAGSVRARLVQPKINPKTWTMGADGSFERSPAQIQVDPPPVPKRTRGPNGQFLSKHPKLNKNQKRDGKGKFVAGKRKRK